MNFSRENNFDLIRLFAALQVAILHGYEHFGLRGRNGAFDFIVDYILAYFPGVPVFFAMSGFLIFHSFSRNNNIRRYTKNRFLRLYPGLWVSFIVTLIILICFNQIDFENLFSKSILVWILAQLTFFQFYTADLLRDYGLGNPNGSLWTIVVEIQYYIFVPLMVYLISKMKMVTNHVLFMLIILSFLANFLIGSTLNPESLKFKLIAVSLIPYLFYFLLGALVYVNFSKISKFIEGRAFVTTLLYILFYLVFSKGLKLFESTYWLNLIGFLSTILMIWMVFALAFSRKKLSKKLLEGVDISYGLYIYHAIVLNFFIERFEGSGFDIFFLYLLTSILLGFISWKLVESPSLKLKKVISNEANNTRPKNRQDYS
tara:strand:- start:82329 stop:83444 length:1116 start_codon:yes stop_codon:yes gene_type:complete